MTIIKWFWEFIKEYSTYNYHAGKRYRRKQAEKELIRKKTNDYSNATVINYTSECFGPDKTEE